MIPKPGSPAFRASLSRKYEQRLLLAVKAAARDCGRLHRHAGAPSMPLVSHRHDGDGRMVVEVSLHLPAADGPGWGDE